MSWFQRCAIALAPLLVIGAPATAVDQTDVSAAIRSVLVTQGEAWNRGDLPTYLTSFARNDGTRHVFNDEITQLLILALLWFMVRGGLTAEFDLPLGSRYSVVRLRKAMLIGASVFTLITVATFAYSVGVAGGGQ